MTLAMRAQQTCAEQCWYARQDTCRCSCNGANHGCLLVNGAPLPGRTRRVQETRYRLAAVMSHEERFFLYRKLQDNPHWAFQTVPKACKWPEAAAHINNWGAMFAWIESTISEEQAQAEMEQAKSAYDVSTRLYHVSECDGITTHYRYPKIAKPCGNPEYHTAMA